MKQSSRSALRLGSFACLLVLHFCTATASRAAILAGPITNAANGHIYYLLSPTNWPSAEAEAVSLHGHLATINDAAENTWVFNRFATNGGVARSLWLGLNDAAQEGNWVWVSGEAAAYRNWAPGEPNNGGGFYPNEDQAVMRGPALDYSDSWNDAPGEQIHAAVVEVVVGSPQTNDLWDVNQGVIVTASSPFDAAFGSPHPYDARDLLGGTFGDYLPEQGSVVFNDGQPAGFVHFVEWRTPSPVTVGSFKLYAFGSADQTIKREFTSFKLRAKSPGSAVFDSVLCEFSPQHPYVFEDERSYLLLSRTISPVTAQDFRAEFTDMGNSPFSGPRIVELDGFPPEVPPPQTNSISAQFDFSTNSNPNGVWSYGYSTILGAPMTLFSERGKWAGLDYWRAPVLLGVPGVYRNPANFTVTNGTGTAVLGPGQLSLYPGPNGEFCVIRFAAPGKGSYQVSGAFTGVDPHGTFTDVHILVNGVIFNGSVTGFGAGSGPTFNLIVDLNPGDPIDFVVGRSANTQFSFDSTGLSVQIIPPLVGIPPTITSQPQSRSVNAGPNLTFFVTATGTAPLSYQWRRNETNLAGATGPSLTLSNVQPANAGIYSVRVTNAFGAATSSNAALTVLTTSTNCVAPPSGLVSWWRAEGNAVDSADSNHGTLAGNATFGVGRVGQAFVFDGSGDAVRVGNPTNLQLQNFTIEAWIQRSSTSIASFDFNGGVILGYGEGGYALGILDDGRPFLTKVEIDNVILGSGISDTNFHHVAVTKSGNTVFFYIDGVAYAVAPYNTTYTFATPAAIGARGDTLRNAFFGRIDEVAVYGRALGAAEIQAIYNASTSGKCAPPAGIAPTITSQPQSRTVNAGTNVTFFVTATGTAPLSYQWRRNETNLAGATGSSLTLSNVQPANAGIYSVRVSNAFGAVTSSNAVLAVLAPSTNCVAPPPGLVSWWRAEDPGPGQATLLAFDELTATSANDNWAPIPNGYGGMQWNNFGVLNGLSRPVTEGYRTGTVSPQNVAFNLSGDSASFTRPTPFTLRSAYMTAAFVNGLQVRVQGWIGTTLAYSNSYALTTTAPSLLTFNYVGVDRVTFTTVPASIFVLDNLVVDGANNVPDSADANHGTLAGNASYGAGRIGQALVLDGNGDGVRIGNPTNLQLQNFTIETWIKRTSPSVVSFSSPGLWAELFCYGTGGYAFGLLNSGQLFLSKVDIDQTQTPVGIGITDTNFHHVAVTKSGSVVVFYIDGTAYPVTPYGTTYTFTTPAGIGVRGDNLTASLYGRIDELAIYNRALSASEVQGIYDAGGSGKCGLPAGIPPTIASQPQSRTVNAGTNVTFFVTATGTTPLSYQWRRNETNLPGATGTFLTLSNVQPANAGTYSVRVTNAFGAVTSSNAVLTVLPPSSPILAGPITNPANGHIYFLIASNTWTGAEAQAVNMGGHLVTINDAAENAWVLSAFGSFGGVARPLWIGLNDAALEGAFVWVSGEAATYRNWMPGEPNNGGGFVPDEDYVGMRGPGLSFSNAWNDTVNGDLYVGVVEISPLGPGINCVSPPAGLVSWWRAEGNANDSVGTNNGTTPFEMGYPTGEVGQAFDFNGTSRRVSVPDSPTFKLTNSLTIEGWIYARQSNSGIIFIRGDNRFDLDPFILTMLKLPGHVAFQIDNDQGQFVELQAPVQLNQWQHIAATLDGESGAMRIYVNGVVRVQTNTTIRPFGNLDSNQQPAIGIGNHGGTTHQFPFNGMIDEISLYSRALSPNEIQAIYLASGNGKCINRTPIAEGSRLTSLVCVPGTKAKLCFAGVAGNTYTVQASTNLIDWEVVGVSVAGPNGVCEFEDSDSIRFASRYYRVVLPRPTRSSWKFDERAARVHAE